MGPWVPSPDVAPRSVAAEAALACLRSFPDRRPIAPREAEKVAIPLGRAGPL